MDENDIKRNQDKRTSRVWSGFILLLAGVLLLAYKIGAPIPHWIFSWPMLLILIGFLTGIKSGFHNAGAFIMMIVGSVFLVDQIIPALNFHNYILPALLIGVGLVYILRPKHTWGNRQCRQNTWTQKTWSNTGVQKEQDSASSFKSGFLPSGREGDAEYVDVNAIFGGVKKNILSKNFKGGEINSFMGGTELNLVQADIQQPVTLVINNIFGGTKLIVPSSWDVKNELTAIFGGIEDKRMMNSTVTDPGKILILKGSCVFGGIEVSNY
ncbi:MAG: LiaF domain-containing protein [Ginsengibacter sp.]